MDKVTYVFDIDGTVCTNTYGDYEKAAPFLERIKKVNQLYDEGHTVFFLTARGMGRHKNNRELAHNELYDFTLKQLQSWNLNFHQLFLGKPNGTFYIDDKGVADTDFFNE